MAITTYGVEGIFPDSQFAQMDADEHSLPGGHGVASGLSVTLSAGADRQVQIASGRAAGAGVVFYASTATNLALPTNTSGKSRVDLIVAQWDWAAARAAFQAAGGIDDLDAASAAAQAAGGSFQSIQGSPGDTPVAPYNILTQVPGDKWQEVLVEQLVRNNVGVFTAGTDDPVDARRLPSTSARTLALPSGWSVPGASPLAVERHSGLVVLSGRFTLTSSSLGPGDTRVFSGVSVIPAGFRPSRVASVRYESELADASPSVGKLVILTDGTMTLYHHTGTFASDQTVRVDNASWIGA